jgi:hypothetical protein
MKLTEHQIKLMKYHDNEMTSKEREDFEIHLKNCSDCKDSLDDFDYIEEAAKKMKNQLPEKIWDGYWDKVHNKIERSVAWVIFISGVLILMLHALYRLITEPSLRSLEYLGLVLALAGLAVLFLSVLKEKLTVNKNDKYISEVQR